MSANETAHAGTWAKVKQTVKAIFGSRPRRVKSEAWKKSPTIHLKPLLPRQWN